MCCVSDTLARITTAGYQPQRELLHRQSDRVAAPIAIMENRNVSGQCVFYLCVVAKLEQSQGRVHVGFLDCRKNTVRTLEEGDGMLPELKRDPQGRL